MPTIELDMLLAFLNELDRYHPAADRVFRRLRAGELRNAGVASSAYLELELLRKSRGHKEAEIRKDLEIFRKYPNLDERPLSALVQVKASEFRESFRLTYFDSLHAATAAMADGQIISVDDAFDRVRGITRVNPQQV